MILAIQWLVRFKFHTMQSAIQQAGAWNWSYAGNHVHTVRWTNVNAFKGVHMTTFVTTSVSLQALVLAVREVYFFKHLQYFFLIYMRCATLVKSPPCVPPKRCASWHCGFDAPVYDLCSCRSLPHTATWHDWKSWQAHGHIMTSAPSQDDGKKGEPSDTERLEWRDQWTEKNRMNRHE